MLSLSSALSSNRVSKASLKANSIVVGNLLVNTNAGFLVFNADIISKA